MVRSVSARCSAATYTAAGAGRSPARIWPGTARPIFTRPGNAGDWRRRFREGAHDRGGGPGCAAHPSATSKSRSRTMRSATPAGMSACPPGRDHAPCLHRPGPGASEPLPPSSRMTPHAWSRTAAGLAFRSPYRSSAARSRQPGSSSGLRRRKFDTRAGRPAPRDGPAGATTLLHAAWFRRVRALKTRRDLACSTWARQEIDIRPAATQMLADIRAPYGEGEAAYDVTSLRERPGGPARGYLFRPPK